jgi:hypothetical protein
MRTAGVVDVIYVNIVTWSVGCEWVGELAKGGAVDSKPGTRVDGCSPPRAKKLVIQVSEHKITGNKGLGWNVHWFGYEYYNVHDLWIMRFWVQVKNKPCVRRSSNMCLISWIHPRGSDTGIFPPMVVCIVLIVLICFRCSLSLRRAAHEDKRMCL